MGSPRAYVIQGLANRELESQLFGLLQTLQACVWRGHLAGWRKTQSTR